MAVLTGLIWHTGMANVTDLTWRTEVAGLARPHLSQGLADLARLT